MKAGEITIGQHYFVIDPFDNASKTVRVARESDAIAGHWSCELSDGQRLELPSEAFICIVTGLD